MNKTLTAAILMAVWCVGTLTVAAQEAKNAASVADTSVTNQAVLIDGENRLPIVCSDFNSPQNSLQPKASANPLSFAKMVLAINGGSARLRLKNQSTQFEIGLPDSLNVSDNLMLIKFAAKTNSREVVTGGFGLAGTSTRPSKKFLVPTKIQIIRTELIGAEKYTFYRVQVLKPLTPGEYGLLRHVGFCDFGVDNGK